MDQIESILNSPLVSIVIGAFLIEWGLSRWQKRPLTNKNFVTILLIALGAKCVLRGFF